MTQHDEYHAFDFFPAMEANKKYLVYFEAAEKLGIELKTYLVCISYVLYHNKLDPVTAYGQAYACEDMPRTQKEKETKKLLNDRKNRAFILFLKDKLGLIDFLPVDWVINITKDIIIDATTLVDEFDRKGEPTGKKTMRDRALAQKTLAMIGGWMKFNNMNLTLGGDVGSGFVDIPKTMTASQAAQIYMDNMNQGGKQ